MPHALQLPSATAFPRRINRTKRTIESKLLEIAERSPKDAAAFHVMADMVITRLNEEDMHRVKKAGH